MKIGVLPPGESGVFCNLLLPEVSNALSAGEPVTALALTQDDIAVGALAGYLENGRFQIASLYVAPDYRRCGGGRMLLEALLRELDGYAFGVEINFTVTQAEHNTLLPFLEVMGFVRQPDNGKTIYVTTLGEVLKSSFFATGSKNTGIPFSQLNEGSISRLKKAAIVANAPLPEGGLSAKTVDRDISVAYINGNKQEAFIIFDTSWSGGLTLSAAWSASKYPMVLPGLLRSAATRAQEKYLPETKIAVQAVNGASVALIRALLPEAEAVAHTYYRPLGLWM